MATTIRMPNLGMIMTEGTLAKWLKSPSDVVHQGEPLAEITTEKITYELEAPVSGIFQPAVQEGEVVPVAGLIAYLLEEGEPVPELPQPQPTPALETASTTATMARVAPPLAPAPAPEGIRASPMARRLSTQLNIDISQVSPSRPGARITEADVRARAEELKTALPLSPPAGMPTPSRVEPVQGMRRIIAEKMKQSLADTAQLTFHLDVDMTKAGSLRKQRSSKSGVTISTVDIFLKACAAALVQQPQLNSAMLGGRILYFDEVNIGLAVALEGGLVVPVVKNVHIRDIFDVAKERASLAAKAQQGKLLPDDLAGGTFTLSVLGSVDGFTPILNSGQTAILGVGRIAKRPVVVGKEMVVRDMATLSLTVDHQVIDGAVAAGFFRRLKQVLERPEPLFEVRNS